MINAGIWVNAVDSLGQTAIYHAVSNGHKEATLLLIMNKAFPDTADDRGKTPLHQVSAPFND
jgi:ankyrin repeat protein